MLSTAGAWGGGVVLGEKLVELGVCGDRGKGAPCLMMRKNRFIYNASGGLCAHVLMAPRKSVGLLELLSGPCIKHKSV